MAENEPSGFMIKLGALMTKLFVSSAQKERIQNATKNLTEAQLADLEAKGCDVTQLRLDRIERKKQEKIAREERAKRAEAESVDYMNLLQKLDQYKSVPHDLDSEFFKQTFGSKKPSKEAQLDFLQNAPFVYAKIVQANTALWEKGTSSKMAVFLVAMDPQYRTDATFLRSIDDKIFEMRNSDYIPTHCVKLINGFNESYFCRKVPKDITEGAEVWCFTYNVNASLLFGNQLMSNGIVPAFVTENFEDNKFAELKIVPAKCYM